MIKIKLPEIVGKYTKIFEPVYIAGSSKDVSNIKIPGGMKEYIDLLNTKLDNRFQYEIFEESDPVIELEPNKKVMIAFSGGKDCVACATKFIENGYDVSLYHLRGINRSYPQEYEHCKEIAEQLGCELYFDTIHVSGKCDYIENPTKNQFILSMMIDCGLKQDIYRYSFGNQFSDTIEGTNPDIMNSDSIELFYAIEHYYQTRIKNFQLLTVLDNLTDSYCQVARYNSELFRIISSCNGPIRFKNYRRGEKEKKFGIKLLPDRCGTCYKCANENVVLNMLGVIDYPDEYIQYCKNVMNKWTDKLYTGESKADWYDEDYIKEFVEEHKSEIKKLEI